MSDEKRAALALAWRRLQHGNGSKEDFKLILADLISESGYYFRPNYFEWRRREGGPEGFELHCALANERTMIVQHIMGFLTLDDDAMIALEKAAKQ